jgi:hypothetical protein
MALKIIPSCCGSIKSVLSVDKPIRKSQIQFFRDAGYFVPDSFYAAGIFYIQQKQFIATASFGSTNINIQCNGKQCAEQIASFEAILLKAIQS